MPLRPDGIAPEVPVEKIKVLLFAANPRDTDPLDLHREFREIDEEIRLGKFRDALELIIVPGTRLVDLLRRLNEHHPHIVHFSGHGNIDEEIILERGQEELAFPDKANSSPRDMQRLEPVHHASGACFPRPLSKSALVDVLKACNDDNIRVVVLNACHTRPQAEALSEVIDCVISMNRAISDVGAIKFAASFYGALAFGRSVKNAFDQGLARLKAEGVWETETPDLMVRVGVDASTLVLVGPRDEAMASEPEPPSTSHRFNPKYYVYIYKTKVEMFYPQISPATGWIRKVIGRRRGDDARNVNRDLYGMTDAVSEFILSHFDVGAVSQPKSYISDRMELRWGTLWDYASDLAVFGNTIDKSVLALIGSSSSLLGQGERIEAQQKGWHSINYYHMRFINQYLESSPKDERRLRKSNTYKVAMDAAIKAINQLPGFTQPFEFLAKTLYAKEFKDRLLIVATPIYVALAE
jgi:hypothetical protein